jgi:3-isopropylmalate/(R)-2-methylmalate dehydratase small subunit
MKAKGKVWRFGDDVNTDEIIPARYLNTFDPDELTKHCMEDADPDFMKKISPGDIIVAGKNFGCGSSREHAPIAIKAAQISCIIADSYARIFYRNSINIGLPIVESSEAVKGISEGDIVEVDFDTGKIINHTKNLEYTAKPFPPFMQELIAKGGLMNKVKSELACGNH